MNAPESSTEAVPATLDVTLQIPLQQLLASYTERIPPYRGIDPDDDYSPPQIVLDVIGERVAQVLADEQRAEVRKMVRERLDGAIQEQVAAAVTEAIDAPVQRTDGFGRPTGEPTTLHALILAETQTWLTKETGDYNRRSTNLQRYLTAEVDKAIKADLDASMKTARAEVTKQLQNKAVAAITTTIASMSRGL